MQFIRIPSPECWLFVKMQCAARHGTGEPAGKNPDVTFHDRRDSVAVRLALADATVPQIAIFTGHSLRDVEAIVDGQPLRHAAKLAGVA